MPFELDNIKTLDLACGTGAFTIVVARRMLEAARNYYANNPDTIRNKDGEFPDAYKAYDGSFFKLALFN